MARITCKTPSNGRPLNIVAGGVGTSWTTVAEAPDFSVPDPSATYATRDPTDATRAIRPGEVALLTPLLARNTGTSLCWIEVRLLLESGTAIDCPGVVQVPAGETAAIAIQGRSLMKRVATGTNGDQLQVRAQVSSTFDIWGTAEERPTAEHVGVV